MRRKASTGRDPAQFLLQGFRVLVTALLLANAAVAVVEAVGDDQSWFYPSVVLLALGAFCIQFFVEILVRVYGQRGGQG
jgi:hypothetical protein